MRPTECQRELLRRLAAMPFLDRLELAAISGWSRGAVYEGMGKMESAGLAASMLHGTHILPPTRRHYLTQSGLHLLAREEGMTVEELLLRYPVSAQWQRLLLGRLDALASVYRLTSVVSAIAHPIRFTWYRAMPMDSSLLLPDGRVLSVVRLGPTSDRTGFRKRVWRLREGPQPSAVLALVPDEVRLRHARRLLSESPAIAFLALEGHVVSSGPGAAIWRTPSGPAALDLSSALAHVMWGGYRPVEKPLARSSMPQELDLNDAAGQFPGHLLPALLKPGEKRVMDLLSDWPWITPAHLGGLLRVKRSRLSHLLQRLSGMGLMADGEMQGRRCLALTDRGLGVLARRDRTPVGTARRRWSVNSTGPEFPSTWRNVSGGRSRQLFRNVDHTDAVHWFLAALSRHAHEQGWEVVQLDPPRRASRYFRYDGRLHSVHPDAFGILRREAETFAFFLEWERRAVRPVTMAARIAPYLRYYSSQRPVDDHGALPTVLVVLEDEITQTHFLRVAREEMARARVEVPLWVSHRRELERIGPCWLAWLSPYASQHVAFGD